ncbi:MAG: M23 family metallopeptidase [Candidatus Eisenbacteria bacterium]|uniref:M23 family metallopeptidase n=1 Tax=Eiseniibacteriota bacterium TaxID=2212470 RepID=A0A538U6U0_UNCEI|nr:MAG: M23 family metallopeptidase [Candidatus Eisenbacteria bacterium]
MKPPLVVTGGFGEYRVGHFHAGYDFGTNKKVGQPVFAPLSGHVERIRASGVGYGRSLYLRTRDGRLLQFGHLDAFAEPMASWVRAKQDSDGVYEQDLWPEASRFPITLGQRIAWTGESGAGGPHMHFEIRRGDMAYQPQLAGLKVRDDRPPTIASVTLEPLDDTSYVERSAGPVTRTFGARPETLRVIGRVRAIVGARDGTWTGVDRMVPWLTRMEWGNQWIECRMDSISWATDMNESDYLYDAGRVTGEKGIVLWASRGFRPRFIRSSMAIQREAGTIEVRRGDPPLKVALEARDVAGNSTRRSFVIRPGEPDPDLNRASELKHLASGNFTALPYGFFRVIGRRIERREGMAGSWIAIIRPTEGQVLLGSTNDMKVRPEAEPHVIATMRPSFENAPVSMELPQAARFDSSGYLVRIGVGDSPRGGLPGKSEELTEGNSLFEVEPETEPLRSPMKLRLPASERPHAGVYRRDEESWSWVGDAREGKRYELTSMHLGWFAEFVDTLAPRIELHAPPHRATPGPYNRWAVEAKLIEHGSGVDGRKCYLVVDGKKVAAEWDPEAVVLRWRPLKRPASGTHKYDVIAEDHAGNQSVRSGTFVLD